MSADYQVRGEVAVITLNNPPVNGLGYETRKGITDALERANTDAAVKAIVITGAGKAFSGGADIKEFGTPKALQEPNLLSVILAVENSAKPVVAALHTIAMGGGLELPLGCHYRIAAPGCKVALPEVKLGLIPGAGGTQRLPRFIGVAKAKELIYLGDMIDAATALNLGLVNKVVPPEKLMEEAMAWAKQLASKSGPILAMAKMAINTGIDTDIASGLNMETKCNALCFATEDQKEGMSAFLAKPRRNPVFKNK